MATTERMGVDPLAVLDAAVAVRADAIKGRDADNVLNVSSDSVKRACGRIAGKLERIAETRAAVAELVAAANKAKAALLTGQIGHITSDDVGVYHLEGPACGNALDALRAALSPFSEAGR